MLVNGRVQRFTHELARVEVGAKAHPVDLGGPALWLPHLAAQVGLCAVEESVPDLDMKKELGLESARSVPLQQLWVAAQCDLAAHAQCCLVARYDEAEANPSRTLQRVLQPEHEPILKVSIMCQCRRGVGCLCARETRIA